jgi:hypothetical protein
VELSEDGARKEENTGIHANASAMCLNIGYAVSFSWDRRPVTTQGIGPYNIIIDIARSEGEAIAAACDIYNPVLVPNLTDEYPFDPGGYSDSGFPYCSSLFCYFPFKCPTNYTLLFVSIISCNLTIYFLISFATPLLYCLFPACTRPCVQRFSFPHVHLFFALYICI